jgi:hypothetical protein
MNRTELIEITFTREELRHLYDFLLKNHLQVKQSVIDKIDEKLIAEVTEYYPELLEE